MSADAGKSPPDRRVPLLIVGGFAVAVASYLSLVQPALSDWREMRQEHAKLQKKIEDAEKDLKRAPEIAGEVNRRRGEMEGFVQGQIPDPANPMSWASVTLSEAARAAGLEVASVSEVFFDRGSWNSTAMTNAPIVPYSVRIQLEGGYPALLEMVRTLESANPLTTVAGLTVACSGQNPTSHVIDVTLQWPAWRQPDVAAKLLTEETKP